MAWKPLEKRKHVEPLRGSTPPAISGCGLRPVNIGSVKPFKGFTWLIPSLGHVTRWRSPDSADARVPRPQIGIHQRIHHNRHEASRAYQRNYLVVGPPAEQRQAI